MSERLPGAMITFSEPLCSGYHENQFGVGSMDFSLRRTNSDYQWVDLGHVYFSHPTQEKLLDAETSPYGTDGNKAATDIKRRVSFKQANYINLLIQEMLMKEFNGVIPPDDEIDELRKARFGR